MIQLARLICAQKVGKLEGVNLAPFLMLGGFPWQYYVVTLTPNKLEKFSGKELGLLSCHHLHDSNSYFEHGIIIVGFKYLVMPLHLYALLLTSEQEHN